MNSASHLCLKDHYNYHDPGSLYLFGGRRVPIAPNDAAVLDCLLRGEGDLGVLGTALAELEIGGDAQEHISNLTEAAREPGSILEVIESMPGLPARPDVIVATFGEFETSTYGKDLVDTLRARGLCVVALRRERDAQFERHELDVTYKRFQEHETNGSSFRFIQWARAWVRSKAEATLILTGAQDRILFGDLAARCDSIVCLPRQWPPGERLHDLLGEKSEAADPLEALRSLYLTLRSLQVRDYDKLIEGHASELDALSVYAVQNADLVAYAWADQPHELDRLGVDASHRFPLVVSTEESRTDRPASGPLALVLDHEFLGRISSLVAHLAVLAKESGFDGLCVCDDLGWLRIQHIKDGLGLEPVPGDAEAPVPRAALVLPGFLRRLGGFLGLLRDGTPMMACITDEPHPILNSRSDEWSVKPE
ncbi:MAG: hypothetical protein AAGG01_19615, partial [Planctomycetota bacterium]